MGFFDNAFKSIVNGDLEKSVTSAIDNAEARLDKLAEKGEKLAEQADDKLKQIDEKAQQTGKTIDTIQKKVQ